MAIGQLNHGRITVPVPSQVSGGTHEGFHLQGDEIFAAAPVGIRAFAWGRDTACRRTVDEGGERTSSSMVWVVSGRSGLRGNFPENEWAAVSSRRVSWLITTGGIGAEIPEKRCFRERVS
jgi:hypothetical protein